MAVLLQDDFTRANSTNTVGSPTVGPTPTVLSGVAGINGNQLYFPTIPSNVVWSLGTPNVEITMTNPNTMTATGVSILLGVVDTNNYWQVHFNTGSVGLNQLTAGNLASVYDSKVRLPAAINSVCRAHYRDRIIRAYVNDTLVLRWELPDPITAIQHGVRSSIAARYVDSILGEDAPTITELVTGGTVRNDFNGTPASAFYSPSFAYLGRDTKLQDIAEGA